MGVTTTEPTDRTERPAPPSPRRSDRFMKPLAWATLVAQIAIVVTGGAVRLTGSGLGCPTWPRCTDESFSPHGELEFHSAIEFGNRMLTFALVAIAVATFVVAWRTRRRELRLMSLIIALGIPAQAVIGGITVLTDLNPWLVALHLLCSMAIIGVSVRLLLSVEAPLPPARRGPPAVLAWATFATAWVVLYLGTVVTGSGPHAGDARTERNGLDPLQMSQLHADIVFLFMGLVIGLLVTLHVVGGPATVRARRAVVALLVISLAQGTIGFVQYFTDLPEVLVGFHMLGAALVSASVTWVLLRVRRPVV
ncbi:COX15/CtaA family protein [Nocardioides flavescens]|nr:COX15/CtaA family protein [Nocardioides flavescens]